MKVMWDKQELIKLIKEHGTITPEKLLDLIDDTSSIVVDINLDNKLEFNLNGEIVAKINRALLTPLTLSEFKLVGVNPITAKGKKVPNATEQKNIGIDSNTLEIDENNNLRVKGGGNKLYQHQITINRNNPSVYIQITIFNNSTTPFTLNTLKTFLVNKYSGGTPYSFINGYAFDTIDSKTKAVYQILCFQSTDSLFINIIDKADSISLFDDEISINDKVIEII